MHLWSPKEDKRDQKHTAATLELLVSDCIFVIHEIEYHGVLI